MSSNFRSINYAANQPITLTTCYLQSTMLATNKANDPQNNTSHQLAAFNLFPPGCLERTIILLSLCVQLSLQQFRVRLESITDVKTWSLA